MKKYDKDITMRRESFLLLILGTIAVALLSWLIIYSPFECECSECLEVPTIYHIDTCPKTDFSVISQENIDKFCTENGYSQGWPACGIDVGFTCHKENAEGYEKYDCFEFDRLLEVKN